MDTHSIPRAFSRETLIRGVPSVSQYLEIDGQTYSVVRGPATTVSLEAEWYEDVKNPAHVIHSLQGSRIDADLFTFWQRVPDCEAHYSYHCEWESIAALRIQSYDHWFNKQISSRTRSQLRKATRDGLEVRETVYDDAFVRGMTKIFNETPVRQGRPFWHYGKDFGTVKAQFARNLSREEMIGAYFEGELIGLIMLGLADRYALPGQIISMIRHRDKATNTALVAKAVEICARKALPYFVYMFWAEGGLSEFKRRCGFEETRVPRYFVPLTARGRVALKLGFHRGWSGAIPEAVKQSLKKLRRSWFERRGI